MHSYPPHPSHAVTMPPLEQAPPEPFQLRVIDWLVPLIFAPALYMFSSFGQAIYVTVTTQFPATGALYIYGLMGTIIFAALFAFAPAKSAGTRSIGLLVTALGLLVTFAQPFITASIFSSSSIYSSMGTAAVLVPLVTHALVLALVTAGWFVLRGFHSQAFAWLALMPFTFYLMDLVGTITLGGSNAYWVLGSFVPRTLYFTLFYVVVFAAGILPANANAPRFERMRFAVKPAWEPLAIAAFACGFFFSIGATILGHVAIAKIEVSGVRGKGLALTGLVMGYAGIILSIALLLRELIRSGVIQL